MTRCDLTSASRFAVLTGNSSDVCGYSRRLIRDNRPIAFGSGTRMSACKVKKSA